MYISIHLFQPDFIAIILDYYAVMWSKYIGCMHCLCSVFRNECVMTSRIFLSILLLNTMASAPLLCRKFKAHYICAAVLRLGWSVLFICRICIWGSWLKIWALHSINMTFNGLWSPWNGLCSHEQIKTTLYIGVPLNIVQHTSIPDIKQ